jgi:hypothetical protein
MKLSQKEQLQAITTALTVGATQYRNDAALQNAYGNMDGELFAVSREQFLSKLRDYFVGQSNKGTFADDKTPFAERCEDIAAVAGSNVRSVLDHSAIEKAGGNRSGEGVADRD